MPVLYRDLADARGPREYRALWMPDAREIPRQDNPVWASAQSIAWGPQPYRTFFRAGWSVGGMHIRFDCVDDRPWHTMTTRDEHLWEEEVVEIFLDPAGSGRDHRRAPPAGSRGDRPLRAPARPSEAPAQLGAIGASSCGFGRVLREDRGQAARRGRSGYHARRGA